MIVVVMLLVVPVGVMFGGAAWSALFGWLGSDTADERAANPPVADDAHAH